MKIPKQEYTAELKELAVKRVKAGQAVGAGAKELGLIEQTLRNWVKAADAGKLNGPGVKSITPEQMELSRLRAENIRLKREWEELGSDPMENWGELGTDHGFPLRFSAKTERKPGNRGLTPIQFLQLLHLKLETALRDNPVRN